MKPQRRESDDFLGLEPVLRVEDADLAADLRRIWPSLPDWRTVETFIARAFLGDPDVQQCQIRVSGKTGRLVIVLTMATDEAPRLDLVFQPATPIRLYAEGHRGISSIDQACIHSAIKALHLRHHVALPGIH
jgi:hypothetical protein